jgi:hypothetical protein
VVGHFNGRTPGLVPLPEIDVTVGNGRGERARADTFQLTVSIIGGRSVAPRRVRSA